MSCLPLSRRLLEEEVRSFPQRIKAAREITLGFSSGSPALPKELECFSVSGPNSHIRAYRQDMQRLMDRFPFVTTQDLYLATLAWKLGTQNRGRSSCSESDRSTLSTSLARGKAVQ
jgi:hypothetical protein